MAAEIRIGDRLVGDGHPVFVLAEIGINHNGDVETAKRLIDAAVLSGCDAVKFQKRTPELCVPPDQRDKMRETPWGYITYLDYRRKVELDLDAYRQIDRYCEERGLTWFASCWDASSVEFLRQFDPVAYKVPSAAVTDLELLAAVAAEDRSVILSTGMSTMEQIRAAVDVLGTERLLVTHCTSTYPCPLKELNLRMIETLKAEFPCPVGYSGHEVGLATTVAAVALGACYVERHITLDRAMWGSDQAASVEPHGIARLVKYLRSVETALGDGLKRVYPSEQKVAERLRRTR
jgi:N-acetylneuraminate synthase